MVKRAEKKGAKKAGGRKPAPKKPSTRRRKLEDAVLNGETPAKAARGAGYSESFARVDVYRVLANPSFQERLEKRRAEAQRRADIHTDSIIGSLVEIANASLGDVVEEDELLAYAREQGTDHLIKKIKVKTRLIPTGPGKEPEKEVTHEFEMYSRLDALSQLRDTFGMKQEARPNNYEEIRRREVEKSISRIMEAEGVDKPTAAKMLLAELGDAPDIAPIINSYVH